MKENKFIKVVVFFLKQKRGSFKGLKKFLRVFFVFWIFPPMMMRRVSFSACISASNFARGCTPTPPSFTPQPVHKYSSQITAAVDSASGDDSLLMLRLRRLAFFTVDKRKWIHPLVYFPVTMMWSPSWLIFATMCCLFVPLQRLLLRGRSYTVKKNLSGQTALILGSTSGIGLQTAIQLASNGCRVIVSGRPVAEYDIAVKAAAAKKLEEANVPKPSSKKRFSFVRALFGESVEDGELPPVASVEELAPPSDAFGSVQSIRRAIGKVDDTTQILYEPVNLADPSSVRDFAKRIKDICGDGGSSAGGLDIVVNSSGYIHEDYLVSKMDRCLAMETNFLGPFYLIELLLPLLRRSVHGGRLVTVSCGTHGVLFYKIKLKDVLAEVLRPHATTGFALNSRSAYSLSKLCCILHTKQLSVRVGKLEEKQTKQGSGAVFKAVVVIPGACETGLVRNLEPFWGPFGSNLSMMRLLWLKTAFEASQTVVRCCVDDTVQSGESYYECTASPSCVSRKGRDGLDQEILVRWAVKHTHPDQNMKE